MIERRPHPVFAAIWLVLTLLSVGAGVIGLRGTWQGWFAAGVLAAIAIAEAVAVVYEGPEKLRDTWSEITTWVNRKLSKHLRPVRGWNSLVAIQALALGRLLYVVGVFFGAPAPYAATVGVIFALGMHDHWLDPGKNG